MKKNYKFLVAGFALLLYIANTFAVQPNILFIYSDDQSRDEFNFVSEGTINGEYRNLCPNIDMLCNEGTIFSNFYLSSSTCTPSRYTLLTGEYASRSLNPADFDDEIVAIAWNTKIDANKEHTAGILKDAGYYTGFVGKNHTYEITGITDPNPTGNLDLALLEQNQNKLVNQLKNNHEYDYAASVYEGNVDSRRLPIELQVHNMDWIINGAVNFLDEANQSGKPFYLHLATTITHIPSDDGTAHNADPLNTPLGFLDTPLDVMPPRESIDSRVINAGKSLSQADITWMDDAIGALLDKLSSLGMLDNTIIMYFNDNGPAPGKGHCYDIGAKSFGFIWGYGQSGIVYDKPISNIDIAPTIYEMAGISQNTWPVMDGNSMVSILNDPTQTLHESIFLEVGCTRAVIKDNMKYLAFRLPASKQNQDYYHWGKTNGGKPLEHAAAAAHPHYFDEDQLYDISDINETVSLANDPAYQATLADLKTEMQRYLCDLPGDFAELKSNTICNNLPTQYSLVVNISGQGIVNPYQGSYEPGEVVTLTATPAAGYIFDSWSGDVTGTSNPVDITMNSDMTVTAVFVSDIPLTEMTLTVTDDSFILDNKVNLNMGSEATISVKNTTRKVGLVKFDLSSVTDPVLSAVLEIKGTNAASGGNLSVYSVTDDSWNENTVTYSTRPSKGALLGSTTLGASGTVYSIDISDFVVAESNGDNTVSLWLNDNLSTGSRYDFASKEAAGEVGPKLVLQLDGGTGVTYELITTAVNGSVSPSGGEYGEGEVVSLIAIPDAGYEFDSWSGDVTGTSNPVSVTMNTNKSVTANFVAIPTYILTVTSLNGSVSPPGGLYYEGEEVILTATPAAGYIFDSWSGDVTGTTNPISIIMDSDKSVTANYIEQPDDIITNLIPSDDSYIKGGTEANSNYGTASDLKIRNNPSKPLATKVSYIKFDLSLIGTVSDAQLSITNNSATGAVDLVEVTDDNWTESVITWNNAPVTGAFINIYNLSSAGTTYTLDVTSYVYEQANGDNTVSFALVEKNNNNLSVSSKEGASAPLLTITHDGIPKNQENYEITANTGTSSINLYPNPTSGLVKLKIEDDNFTEANVKIVSAFGVLIDNSIIYSSEHTLNMEYFNEGLYFIIVSYDNATTVRSVIKK